MKTAVSTLLLLAWALWLGGLIALFIFAQALFAHDRPTALSANPVLFHVFERYQLGLAAAALVSAGAMAAMVRSRAALCIVILVVLSTTSAVLSTTMVTRKMQSLTAAGQSSSPQFKKLHGQSMLLYTASAALLAGVGILFPGLLRQQHKAQ